MLEICNKLFEITIVLYIMFSTWWYGERFNKIYFFIFYQVATETVHDSFDISFVVTVKGKMIFFRKIDIYETDLCI